MSRALFVNLPDQALPKSIVFFEAPGFSANPQFTNEPAAGIVISDESHVMLLAHSRCSDLTPHPGSDAATQTQVLITLSCGSREETDQSPGTVCEAANAAVGARADNGFMCSRSIHDLDDHVREPVGMDPDQMPHEATAG
ncbi:MAG: VOC family protein [Maioricimonas sp. JB049]